MRTLREALVLLAAGGALSLLALVAGGPLAAGDAPQLVAAVAAQVPVVSWGADDVREGEGLLVVDGRPAEAHAASRPAASVSVPFEDRDARDVALPDGRPIRAAVVVMAVSRRAEARALAQWCARAWGVPVVATFRGGWPAWRAAGLPVEGTPEVDR